MAKVTLSTLELRQVDKAIRLLRDRHYRNYYNAKDIHSVSAREQYRIYEELDELRNRISLEARSS